ncbi:MAG: alanyl-tRNA editing protein [archaeon]|nr:alanyl-tRNA editing protein [Nanoarchaeota archaeon]
MSTKKLFWEDPYQTECKAKVTSIDGNKVKLDQTIFFAFSGGQESDSGTIAGYNVLNAVKLGDKENIIDIEYELELKESGESINLKVGDEIEVKIDAEKRMKLMKLHSAAHAVYYFMIEAIGKHKIIGSNITSDKARVDFAYEKSIGEVLLEVEEKVNVFMAEGHAIESKDDENNPDLKWWTCSGWKMPCGGTHVKNTSEIGNIQLKRKNLGAGKERVEVLLI